MSQASSLHSLPGFEALCQAIGQPAMSVSDRQPSPPATPMPLLTEPPFARPTTGTHSQGWFDVRQEEVQNTLDALQPLGLDRDRLYQLAFEVDPGRALYEGDDTQKKSTTKLDSAKPAKQRDACENHSRVEKRRRLRHQRWQVKSHRMVSEFAHQCITNDREYLAKDDKAGGEIDSEILSKGKASKSRTPKAGKDESFCGTIYSLSVCGIVLQSEHEGRKLAEKQAQMLADRVVELEAKLAKTTRYPPSPSASPTWSSSSNAGLPRLPRL